MKYVKNTRGFRHEGLRLSSV